MQACVLWMLTARLGGEARAEEVALGLEEGLGGEVPECVEYDGGAESVPGSAISKGEAHEEGEGDAREALVGVVEGEA